MTKRGAAASILIIALAAMIVGCGFVRWPVSAGWVTASLNSSFRRVGLVTSPSGASLRLLPWPNLQLYDARLDTRSGANVAAAPEARFDLSLVDLLQGRLAPSRALLINPIVTLDLSGFSVEKSALAAASEPIPLANVTLADGVLHIIDRDRGIDAIVESVQGRIDGLAANRPQVNLAAVWRDAPIQISAALSDGAALAARRSSPFAFRLISAIASIAFKGELAGAASPVMTGNVSLAIGSIADLARLLRVAPPSYMASDDLAVSARVTASLRDIGLSDATIVSGGQKAQGALQATGLGGRPAVSGTLDAERLTLAWLLGWPMRAFDADGAWSSSPFGLGVPRDFDLDLRLSAGQIDAYGAALTNAAVSAILKDGALNIGVLDATVGGGRLQGELKLACAGADLEIGASAKLSDADIGAVAADVGWSAPVGQGTVQFAVSTRGPSPAAAIGGLKGSAAAAWAGGAASGINLEEALRRSQRRTVDWARELRPGQTAFDRLSLELRIADGIARVTRGELASRGLTADFRGAVDLPSRQVELRVDASQTGAQGAEAGGAARLSIDVSGPWSQPTFKAPAPEGTLLEADPP